MDILLLLRCQLLLRPKKLHTEPACGFPVALSLHLVLVDRIDQMPPELCPGSGLLCHLPNGTRLKRLTLFSLPFWQIPDPPSVDQQNPGIIFSINKGLSTLRGLAILRSLVTLRCLAILRDHTALRDVAILRRLAILRDLDIAGVDHTT